MQFSPSKRLLLVLVLACIPLAAAGGASGSAVSTVPLGTAGSFAVLAGTGISDVPTSALSGAVGLSPATGAAITGLTCAEVTGHTYTVDAGGPLPCRETRPGLLTTARSDRSTAYVDAAGRSPDRTYGAGDNQLGGRTLAPGVYRFGHATTANLSGNLTLKGDASSVWIFQATSDLVTAGSSTVTLSGGAQACHVFWQVGSTATLGGSSNLKGTVLTGASITLGNGVSVSGRLLAGAAVTLIADTISRPSCSSATPASGSTPSREIYCDPVTGASYDLVVGQDKEPPYDQLGLVPATVDPVTGAKSCAIPAAAVTTTAATTTTATTTAATTTTATTTTVAAKPAKPPVKKHGTAGSHSTKIVKRSAPRPARHVPPRAPVHPFGITG